MLFHIITLVLSLTGVVLCQGISPCPATFQYESKSVIDRWYGVISLRTPDDLTGVWIDIILDKPAELLGNWFGETSSSSDNTEYTIRNSKYTLQAGPPVQVRFFVKYNVNVSPPTLRTIRLNGKTICSTTIDEESLTPPMPTIYISQVKPTPSSNLGRPGSGSSRPDGHARPSRPGIGSNFNRNPDDYNMIRPTSRPVARPSSSGYDPGNDEPSILSTQGQSIKNNNNAFNERNPDDYNIGSRPTRRPVSRPSSSGFGSGSDEVSVLNNQDQNPNSNNNDLNERNPDNYNMGNLNRPTRRPVSRPSSPVYGTGTDEPSIQSTHGQNLDRNNNGFNERPNTGSNHGLTLGVDDNEDSSDSEFFQGDFASLGYSTRPSSNSQNSFEVLNPGCGTVAPMASPLIHNGQSTIPGQWPWHAALYRVKKKEVEYICGGTLISEQHVLTAGHCVTKPRTNKPVNIYKILVYLGKYNRNEFGDEVQDKSVSAIYVHPDYNHTAFYNDIAVLKLSSPVVITKYVRPACLWSENKDLEYIIDKQGTVAGWGFDEHKKLSTNLMQAQIPVISTVKCIYSKRDFFSQFTFEKNYCAGYKNGTSVCNGDSGGGMLFPKKGTRGQNTVWQIRGILSIGVALQGQGVCDPSHYMIFTDVAKYLDWLNRVMT